MNVKTLANILEKTLIILKHYEHCTVDEMLDDLSTKLQHQKKQITSEIDYSHVMKQIKNMNKEEATTFLSSFKKEQLLQIGLQMNMKLQKRDTKQILIESIVSHCSFPELYAKMANRKSQKQMSEQI
ncbi:hypothetical protein NP92_06035 [Anoxybacillus gonensis]|uniref:Uncharacterized protein n=1 Tax=Anoxybacillus gonensis TaxID=198467 RepID=A0AAW7TCW4_9BACL|nr:hypothetical protein [Anoxybacillus gonensis]AKS38161.1 hypothetical protein AFK25_06260 [Anoxybacillus gonensis]KGP60783.1 hypothetical protein NP92_06035 [Anoxybacillus gonensis]MCQ5365745.1 hypothetical protein [Anoxybacillus gonensis]MDO0877169.1 hypothetical protein [Anoxybacillus gonensis]